MRVIKYYCDICKSEVKSEKDLITSPYMIESGGHKILTTREICNECIKEMSRFLKRERFKSDI